MAAYIYARPFDSTKSNKPHKKHMWMLPFHKKDFDHINGHNRVYTIIATDDEATHLTNFTSTPPTKTKDDEYVWYGDAAQNLFSNLQGLFAGVK